jgi:crotonobetainyl-CoA:carnitine CoA-transferase CaiB-like acyl-CoA transferase
MRGEQTAEVAGRRIHGKELPADALQSTHDVEMAVSAQEREMMLTAEGGDPDIVYWNRLASPPKLNSYRGVVMGRFVGDLKHQAIGD